jgi:hypothetical protein
MLEAGGLMEEDRWKNLEVWKNSEVFDRSTPRGFQPPA